MVRTPSKNSVAYSPAPVPEGNLTQYLTDQLSQISAAITALAEGHIDKTYAAPSKPRDGDFRYADGTTWNPGTGAGFYFYNGSTWTKW